MEWQSSYVVELYAFIKDRIMRQWPKIGERSLEENYEVSNH
jgi:hypothetical protein